MEVVKFGIEKGSAAFNFCMISKNMDTILLGLKYIELRI